MLDGQGSFPNIVIQHLLQIDIIILIQSKWIPQNIGHLHPGINENDLYNLNQHSYG